MSVADEIIAAERAALRRWGRGDPSGFLELCAPEVTYFDPFLPRRLDGLEALRDYYGGLAGRIRIDRYELIEPRVEVRGDVAILTFDYASWGAPGESAEASRWHCSEVYARVGDEWRIVQTHWSKAPAPTE